MMRVRIGMGTVALLWTVGAAAQERGDDHGGAALQPLIACRAVIQDGARLACYEKATAALEQQVRDNQLRIVDRQDIRKAKRSLFGFTLPRIDLFGGRSEDDEGRAEFTEINTTIVSAYPLPNDRFQLRIAEGDAVWTTTEPLLYPPRAGNKVRIRKGPLGNYFIAIAGNRSVRGMRLR